MSPSTLFYLQDHKAILAWRTDCFLAPTSSIPMVPSVKSLGGTAHKPSKSWLARLYLPHPPITASSPLYHRHPYPSPMAQQLPPTRPANRKLLCPLIITGRFPRSLWAAKRWVSSHKGLHVVILAKLTYMDYPGQLVYIKCRLNRDVQ